MPPEIIGHEKILSFLEKSIENKRLNHAYIFVGAAGVGKTTVAEWLIKKMLGPAGFSHPNVSVLNRLIDEKTEKIKSEIVVKQVRELRERLSLSGFVGTRKFAFIEEADVLNEEASNALLKTLEEPAGETTLILRVSSVDNLLPTIVSRCQIIRFTQVKIEEIVKALKNRGVVRAEAESLAALSSGCPGYALRLLRDEETRALEETSVKQFVEIVDSPLSVRLTKAAGWLPKDETNKKEQLKNLLDRWERLLREVLFLSSGLQDLAVRSRAYPELVRLSQKKKSHEWSGALDTLRTIKKDLAINVNPTLSLEHLFLSL